jgi:hypothetical protein
MLQGAAHNHLEQGAGSDKRAARSGSSTDESGGRAERETL